MSIRRSLVKFTKYYYRASRVMLKDIWVFWRAQVIIAILAALLTLYLQFRWGMIPERFSNRAFLSVALPYLWIVAAAFIWHALRAPYLLDRGREKRRQRSHDRHLGINRQLLAEKARNKTPRVKGEIEELYMDVALTRLPDGGGWDCYITLKTHVFDANAVYPSVKFQLEVTTAPTVKYQAARTPLGDLVLMRNQKLREGTVPISEVRAVRTEITELAPDGRVLLTHAQDGWLRFVLPVEGFAIRDIESVTLFAIDDYDTPHPIPCERSQWKQTGKLVRTRDLEHAERVRRLNERAFGAQ